ncbi:MAG: valine--tRNA ligase [bacterium]
MDKKELPKTYQPKEAEDKIYTAWEESGFFNPDNLRVKKEAKKFVISMPPPNVTGELHMGHALALTLEDIMIRYHRLKGELTLWLPGVDHAAIATQNVVERKLAKVGFSKENLGREKFLEKINEHINATRPIIESQIRKVGSSCDWSREAYTLDENLSQAVKTMFVRMYQDGLIYRGYRIVNWCPKCNSTLADDEVEYKEQSGKLYYIKYNLNNTRPITVATTRPETKIGDTGVAVHPDDKRYQNLIGKTFEVSLGKIKIKIKIFADKQVDPQFGTGAIGVTPAHSLIDWQWAQKYGLEIRKIIDEKGKMTQEAGPYAGLPVKLARDKFVEDLKNFGLLEKIEDYQNNISLCYRCESPIEPLPSRQWFVAVDKEYTIKNKELIKKYGRDKTTLKKIAKWAIEKNEIEIIPGRFKKIYLTWMDNLYDWCISRQIWFGHRVPVWYCQDCKEIIVSENGPAACPKCKSKNLIQDPDTLDTWFSSALWTFSTLGWPNACAQNQKLIRQPADKNQKDEKEKKSYLERFHPTSVMETGYDILFFWVARMIIASYYALGEKPFETVYLHGLIRDKQGQKMSKSRPETSVNPISVVEKYGADALRLSLIIGTAAGADIKILPEKIAGYAKFINKLYNIGRFIQLQEFVSKQNKIEAKTLADQWLLSRFHNLIKSVTEKFDSFQFSAAIEELYEFSWHELADWSVEISKIEKNYELLKNCYLNLLKLLHPFIPFVSETIWQSLAPHRVCSDAGFGEKKMLIIENWPKAEEKLIDKNAEAQFEIIKNIVTEIRNYRSQNKIDWKTMIALKIHAPKQEKLISQQKKIIEKLAKVELKLSKEKLKSAQIKLKEIEIEIYKNQKLLE